MQSTLQLRGRDTKGVSMNWVLFIAIFQSGVFSIDMATEAACEAARKRVVLSIESEWPGAPKSVLCLRRDQATS